MWESKDFILTAVTVIVTLVLREGGPLLTSWMNQTSSDKRVRAELENKGYEAVICRLDKQVTEANNKITALEAALDAAEKREFECEKRFILMESKMQQLETRLSDKK